MTSDSIKEKTYVHWTSEMDHTLSNILLEEHGNGHKTLNGWKDVAFTATINGMKEAHNITFTKEKIMTRLKTWNKYYKEVPAMLDTSGFGWDWERNIVKVDSEEVWVNYVTAHPTVKHYRDKIIINWSKLGILCDTDKSTGSFAATTNDTVNEFDVGSFGEESIAGEPTSVAGSSRQGKRKANPAEVIANPAEVIASAITQMATSMKQTAITITDVAAKPTETSSTQIYEALGQLCQMDHHPTTTSVGRPPDHHPTMCFPLTNHLVVVVVVWRDGR